MAYHILQSGFTCRLPKTPRSKFCLVRLRVGIKHDPPILTAPRSLVNHYFDVRFFYHKVSICVAYRYTMQETIDSRSECGDDIRSMTSAISAVNTANINTLGDISPDAL